MNQSLQILKFRYYVSEAPGIALAGCVAVCLFGLAVAFTGVLGPGIAVDSSAMGGTSATGVNETTTETVHLVGLDQNVETRVTRETAAYDSGTVLRNQNFYPLANTTSPTVETRVDVANATVTAARIYIRLEAVHAESDETFWTDRVMVTESDQRVDSGSAPVTMDGTVPIQQVHDRIKALQDQFGPRVDINVYVVSEAEYRYYPAGANASVQTESVNTTSQVQFEAGIYRLPHGEVVQTNTTGGEETDSGPVVSNLSLWNLLFLGIAVGGVGSAGAVYWVEEHDDPDDLMADIYRLRHADWITTVNSVQVSDVTDVNHVPSLAELVDYAIDTHNRVLHNQTADEYVVVDGSSCYVFVPDWDTTDTSVVPEFADASSGSVDDVQSVDGNGFRQMLDAAFETSTKEGVDDSPTADTGQGD